MFIVWQLSKQNADLRVGHLKAVKRVVQYLKSTIQLKLTYGIWPEQTRTKSKKKAKIPMRPVIIRLIGYINSNYASDLEDRKSVIGNNFFIYRAIVFWCHKKQCIVSPSITKAEYITLGHSAWKCICIKRFLNERRMEDPIGPYLLHRDNGTSIIFIRNVESQARTKHINMQHHYICELVADKEIEIE